MEIGIADATISVRTQSTIKGESAALLNPSHCNSNSLQLTFRTPQTINCLRSISAMTNFIQCLKNFAEESLYASCIMRYCTGKVLRGQACPVCGLVRI